MSRSSGNDALVNIGIGLGLGVGLSFLVNYVRNKKQAQQLQAPAPAPKKEYPEVKLSKVQAMKDFMAVYSDLVKFVVDDLPADIPQSVRDYMTTMMDYNVPGGKLNRGLTVVDTLLILKDGRVSDELLYKARILGWCIEFLQAYFLVEDDIMDASHTRRGEPCWYKLPNIGIDAVNDGMLLDSFIYRILKHYFGQDAHYRELVELFQETTWQTEIGQHMDLTSQPKPKTHIDLSRFTIDLYKRIVLYKTAFYSFYMPVALGAIVADMADEGVSTTTSNVQSQDYFKLVREITLEMGEYFQIQDDYLDCFGSPEVIGKVGRDIEEAKCSWLVVQALQRATPEQHAVLQECYGVDDPEKVARVKALYRELNLEQVYRDYEAATVKSIKDKCERLAPGTVRKEIFLALLSKIEGRGK